MQFTVTRQRQWPEGNLVVEISKGGMDYVNPGMLVEKFARLGEGESFLGMTPAVEAGIAVYKAWKERCPDEELGIAVGFTHGCTLPFDGEELTIEVEEALRAEAKSYDERLPKCANCGEILSADERERYGDYHAGEFDCCSESCAEKHYAPLEEEFEDEEEEIAD